MNCSVIVSSATSRSTMRSTEELIPAKGPDSTRQIADNSGHCRIRRTVYHRNSMICREVKTCL